MDPVMHNMNCTKPDAAGKIPHGCQGVGWWYSTTAAGECHGENVPGDGSGCTWRTAATVKTINATCMRDHVVDLVGDYNPACWVRCPGDKTNYTSSCFRDCYELGLRGGMDAARMQNTWDAAFDEEELAQGGCPAITV
jgi:hypothetical protein